MRKKYLNMLVILYLAFLSIFTISITFQKIQTMKQENTADDVMIIRLGDDNGQNVDIYQKENPVAVSKPRVVLEETLERSYVYIINDTDYQTLLRVVEAEAGCEDENGKLLVANVVLNRVNSPRFPSSVKEVVYQATGGKIQFSTAYNGRMNSVKISQQTYDAVERALYGEDISKGALFFISTHAASPDKSSWFYSKLNHVFDYGRHSFFK